MLQYVTPLIFQASGTSLYFVKNIHFYSSFKKVYIDAPCKIESPVAYFLFSQQPLGGWPRFSIPYTSFADYSTFTSLININICLFTLRFLMLKSASSNALKHFSRQKYHRNVSSSSNIHKSNNC